MTQRIFGTDGVRGLANGDITAELAVDLGAAAARVLVDHGGFTGQRPVAVVGRDTRISGQFLEHAVVAGLASAGVDVIRLRVLPTPGVAYLTDALGADVGVVISASHNPMPDNGIKFLARGGVKLDDALEREIETLVGQPWDRPVAGDVGRVTPYARSVEEYSDHLLRTIDTSLSGLRVVLDCANGAASVVGPHTLRAAGADVVAINDDPDGLNINQRCGSTHLEGLREAVLARGADVGFACDGDADRCLAIDHAGNTVDGDRLMAVLALDLQRRGRLVDDTVVATVMSNLGFVQAMRRAGITVNQTAVGDRYVLEAMRDGGFTLGGEQSGHIIMSEYATTGDGILTALQVLRRMAQAGSSLRDLASVVTTLPQVLVNVPDVDQSRTDDPELTAAVAAEQDRLGDSGRVLLRPSGTEPLVRVMVEAATPQEATEVADRLADVVRRRLGG
ncbi:MAG TPA: phosphoglucosamine mutase [Nocardioides sp.]|jgi:phosphoglucosamine mutase|uniref:phosphoglucosamine mutase n=1 Tax=Nocardioides sp. TaxID=35761 RepID=UPI002E2EA9FB|nr:phosphoglucosamine mutase [Nocardioides sp.]HEX3932259.1 phosphoglucosamine mutase [Nocardioides sp.]